MLQNGAAKVYAVDVGTNQLAWKLRQDARVISLEKTNIRYITHNEIPDKISFVSIDVAFISLTKVLLPIRSLLADGGRAVCLVKPQFEAGREKVGKKGVVRDKAVHLEVVENIMVYVLAAGFNIISLSYSPIKGPEGNIEYLLYIEKADGTTGSLENGGTVTDRAKEEFENSYRQLAEDIVEQAHTNLDK